LDIADWVVCRRLAAAANPPSCAIQKTASSCLNVITVLTPASIALEMEEQSKSSLFLIQGSGQTSLCPALRHGLEAGQPIIGGSR
jgi:hypothetical protein